MLEEDKFREVCRNNIQKIYRMAGQKNIYIYGAGIGGRILADTIRENGFCFEAFLPYDKKERARVLEELRGETRTIVLYEAPHRVRKTLAELEETLGGERRLTVCRELTKRFEERMPLTLEEAVRFYEQNEPKGEFVLVIQGRDHRQLEAEKIRDWESISLEAHLQQYLSQGLSKKEAMKQMAKDRGVSKRDIYQELIDGAESKF